MRYLCICHYAHSRSVAMCRYLHGRGHEAVACGAGTAESAIPALCGWADKIVLMEPSFLRVVPQGYRDKVMVIDVGRDAWSNPSHPELAALIERLAAGLVP